MDISHLIEALRGGNDPNGGVVSARRYPNGEILKYPYGKKPTGQPGSVADQLRGMMPVGLRKQQLHNQEVRAGSQPDDKDY